MTLPADLEALARLLRREPLPEGDWKPVVELANRALLTPLLWRSLQARSENMPPKDLHDFIRAVAGRNDQRNARLRGQLQDAVAALQRAGLGCTLLKGTAFLTDRRGAGRSRMLSDLDILLSPGEVGCGIEALQEAGFKLHARYDADDSHVAAELYRDEDVGPVDLHRRAPGPGHIMAAIETGRGGPAPGFEGASIPAPEIRILQLAMHDMFHDGDLWSGAMDLRHLVDIAILTGRGDPVDWSRLSAAAIGGLAHHAVCRTLIASHHLFDASAPENFLHHRSALLDHRRSLLQLSWPALRAPLGLASLAAAGSAAVEHYRLERRWRSGLATPTSGQARRAGRLNRVSKMLRAPPAPKL